MTILVLLPGLDGSGQLFDDLIIQLHPTIAYQIIRYPNNPDLGYDELTDFVRSQLPLNKNIVLLGESFSGPIAIKLAALMGAQIKGLMLCCSFAANPRPALTFLPKILPDFAYKLAFSRSFLHLLLGQLASPKTHQSLKDVMQNLPLEVIKARLISVTHVNVTEQFRELALPMIYFRAQNDLLVPKKTAAYLQQLNSQIGIKEFQGTHFLLQTNPQETAAEIYRFWVRINRED